MSNKKNIGLYFHIPFCDKKCSYCDFYFTTQKKHVDSYISSLCREIFFQKKYFSKYNVKTIYFGGGTPSVLTFSQLQKIVSSLKLNFSFENVVEFTFECNPEHITPSYLKELSSLGVNRVSLGVQSLNSEELKFLNRKSTLSKTHRAIDSLIDSPIKNFNLDILYGVTTDLSLFEDNLSQFISYKPAHISAYALTVEPHTLLGHNLAKKLYSPPSQEIYQEQFFYLKKTLQKENYTHYEISNFALEGKKSIHNSSYWDFSDYIGFGASAHSFVDGKRFSVIRNYLHYNKLTETNIDSVFIPEKYSLKDYLNDTIMLGFRTKNGVLKESFLSNFPNILDLWLHKIKPFIANKKILENDTSWFIPSEQWLTSNDIISELFFLDEDLFDLAKP